MKQFANLDHLVETVQKYEWFCGTGLDEYGRFIVYVNRMDYNVIKEIPAKINKQQVLFHFFHPKLQYITHVGNTIPQAEKPVIMTSIVNQDEINLNQLISDLDSLESVCGSENLAHIFFETHDQHNAITYFSIKYPEIRKKMEKLYQNYGFDILYEQLDL